MIEFTCKELSRDSLYSSTLSQIEYICDEYQLNNHFGTISMANQEVVEYIESSMENFSINTNFVVDNDKLSIVYYTSTPIFANLKEYMEQRQVLSFLADKLDIEADNKSVTLSFLVKPIIKIQRQIHHVIQNSDVSFIKKTFLLLVFCTLVLFSYANPIKVLFIGNSYTEVNNLPNLIQQVANSTGDEITYSASTPGGCTFQNHLTQSLSYIQQGGWDYVVLQEQSQLPSFPTSQFMNESYPYAQMLCDSIRKYSPDAEIVFYMTWGRKYGDQQNAPYFPPLGTYEGMDSLLYERYMMMAEDNNAVISPVGALWHYIRDNYPDIELYQSDNSHPSLTGSYAAACSFYTVLFKKSPLLITENCNLADSLALIIRNAAQNVVYDSLDKWLFIVSPDTTGSDTLSISQFNYDNIRIYPTTVYNYLNIQTGETSVLYCDLYDISGVLLKRLEWGKSEGKLDVSSYDAGFYFMVFYLDNGGFVTRKFIKR